MGIRPADPVEGAPLPPDLARRIVARAEAISGVRVDAARTDFLQLRLGRRLRALGLGDYHAYLALLDRDAAGVETRALVEALTTHTTAFFRETPHYEWLAREGIDRLLARSRSLTVWSAAASIGAELWSAGMILAEREDAGAPRADWRLLGTDISTRVVARATRAVFTDAELDGLSDRRRRRFLWRARRLRDPSGHPVYRIEPGLRGRARFSHGNLQDPASLPAVAADLVFLRNVLIYFDAEAQLRVVDAVVDRLRPGGILMTGHAETLGPHPRLRALRPTIYERI